MTPAKTSILIARVAPSRRPLTMLAVLAPALAMLALALALGMLALAMLAPPAASAQTPAPPVPAPASAQKDTRAAPPATPAPALPPPHGEPLPDLDSLMRTVEAHEKKTEDLLRTYAWREEVRFDHRDGSGAVKKTTTVENEVFHANGIELRRQTKKDGKPLSPEEQRKEDERIEKEVEHAKEKQAAGEPAHHHEQIPLSRFLELGTFSNERRELQGGRSVIAVDYTGNPAAKTRSEGEKAIHDIAGTVWVDEAERSITRLEGHFLHSFKMGAGMLVNIHEGTSFRMQMTRVNEEIWLPHVLDVDGELRAFLLLDVKGHINVQESDFRKYKATSKLLPDMTPVETTGSAGK